jgi:putative chitinase
MITLANSVGFGGKNRPIDLMIVQHLLNLNHEGAGLDDPLPISGELDADTTAAIKSFQSGVMGSKVPDGRVDPGGKTLKKLADPVKLSDTLSTLRSVMGASDVGTLARPGEASSSLSIIDTQAFLGLYERQFFKLGAAARDGFTELIGFINEDEEIADVGWCAYMMATTKHECAEKWEPIKEFGLGAGHPYGNPVEFTDKAGTKHTNTYYGRGYVQLTWKDNYDALGTALGLGEDLLVDPDKVLDPETAYDIMSYGMRNGSFTTAKRKLSDYIDHTKCNYPSARQIINGLDQYMKIAGYATDIEILLRAGCEGSTSHSDF